MLDNKNKRLKIPIHWRRIQFAKFSLVLMKSNLKGVELAYNKIFESFEVARNILYIVVIQYIIHVYQWPIDKVFKIVRGIKK